MHSALPASGSPSQGAAPARVAVLGIAVDRLDAAQAVAWVADAVRTGGAARQVVTLNPEMVMAARRDAPLAAILRGADLVLADGVGIVLAARLAGADLPRVPGADLLEQWAAYAATAGQRVFLLGGRPGVAARAAARLAAAHPGLRVAGAFAGSPAPEEDAATVAHINATAADVLFVAFGSPAQERWIARNRGQLGVAVAVGIGGGLDFAAGSVARAPAWMRRAGLEWLFRLVRQPWRWRRMLALPQFACLALVAAAHPSTHERQL